ncbi:unnamed protein product [Nippostrongylus brasiliensis]|uniref:F-box only protein 34 n=1 Tax=Nippostrongylus brasiliensis TaxID=27835 RepID=A0A0N4YFJ1_NIPBR|nr:unnamed protein product [Nippostrongylus brasiliensis]
MSQENSNMSAPSRIGDRSPEGAGFIEWYDSPKVLLPSQAKKTRQSLLLMKTRSAEEFSPSRSSLNDLFGNDTPVNNSATTPHRSRQWFKGSLRKGRRRSDQPEEKEIKAATPKISMSMEEGLALGRASLAKLRQRLHSEGEQEDRERKSKERPIRTPLRSVKQGCASTPAADSRKRESEIAVTPSLIRSQVTIFTSTPKRTTGTPATSLKRFHTMCASPQSSKEEGSKAKMARTKSLNVMADESDDDSFLDDVFMPFSSPNQLTQLLKHNIEKR